MVRGRRWWRRGRAAGRPRWRRRAAGPVRARSRSPMPGRAGGSWSSIVSSVARTGTSRPVAGSISRAVHAVSCGQEPVLGEDLSVRSGLRRVTFELQTRQRLDQRDEGGHVRERRLGVHDPDLDGPELGLRSHVPPEEVRIGYGPGADHGVERVDVVGVVGEGARWPGAREGLEDDGAHGVEAAVASLRERRVGRQREQDRHAAAQPVEESDGIFGARGTPTWTCNAIVGSRRASERSESSSRR